jgi:hypothetical protein
MDFHSIWQRAKHGSVSEQEIRATEAALRSEDMSDRHVPILIVGLMLKPDPSRIALMDAFLRSGKVDAERYSALRVLCRYWGLWDKYLDYLLAKIAPEEFDRDPTVSDEAFSLLGDYLFQHSDQAGWRRLVFVYDLAVAEGREDLAKQAFDTMVDGFQGKKKSLLQGEPTSTSPGAAQVIAAARSKAGLA